MAEKKLKKLGHDRIVGETVVWENGKKIRGKIIRRDRIATSIGARKLIVIDDGGKKYTIWENAKLDWIGVFNLPIGTEIEIECTGMVKAKKGRMWDFVVLADTEPEKEDVPF